MSWKDHEFDYELGIELPEVPISFNEDWLSDCEEDNVFDLKPEYYHSKTEYEAALTLCRVCAGWYYFSSEEELKNKIKQCKDLLKADYNGAMQYYGSNHEFDWLTMLRDNNPKYKDQLFEIDSIWNLFSTLGERSIIEKADCFEWFINYMGENLTYDARNELLNNYANTYDNSLEFILFLRDYQIDLIANKCGLHDLYNFKPLVRASAGLIRLGKKDKGIELYNCLFSHAKASDLSSEDKKEIITDFIDRLSEGYDGEPYLDEDLANLITGQLSYFSDNSWIGKTKSIIQRNRI